MTGNGQAPRIIPVGQEPPPLDPRPDHRPAAGRQTKAKGKRTAAGRFRTLNAFVDFTLGELGRAEIAVWLVLFRDCRDGLARTAQTDMARRAGIDRRTVYRALRRLEQLGLVRVVRRGRLGSGPSSYRLRWLTAD
ncbi:MAG: helix-turn-helix domain-containing protein [Planctomycetia bacterium]|nr:helix-turn-helix domain-containing protein [Planctomycetia bacterium]